jgi:hypothetical protein
MARSSRSRTASSVSDIAINVARSAEAGRAVSAPGPPCGRSPEPRGRGVARQAPRVRAPPGASGHRRPRRTGQPWCDERLRPAVELADPVPRLEGRRSSAGLELPVLLDAHAEAPRGLPDPPTGLLPIMLEHRGQHRHPGLPQAMPITGSPPVQATAARVIDPSTSRTDARQDPRKPGSCRRQLVV